MDEIYDEEMTDALSSTETNQSNDGANNYHRHEHDNRSNIIGREL